MESSSESKYRLIFEGAQTEDPEKLRSLKLLMISDLNLSVDQVREIFENAPVTIHSSANEDQLSSMREKLHEAGAKVLLVKPDRDDDEEDAQDVFEFDIDIDVLEGKESTPKSGEEAAPRVYSLEEYNEDVTDPEIESLLAGLGGMTVPLAGDVQEENSSTSEDIENLLSELNQTTDLAGGTGAEMGDEFALQPEDAVIEVNPFDELAISLKESPSRTAPTPEVASNQQEDWNLSMTPESSAATTLTTAKSETKLKHAPDIPEEMHDYNDREIGGEVVSTSVSGVHAEEDVRFSEISPEDEVERSQLEEEARISSQFESAIQELENFAFSEELSGKHISPEELKSESPDDEAKELAPKQVKRTASLPDRSESSKEQKESERYVTTDSPSLKPTKTPGIEKKKKKNRQEAKAQRRNKSLLSRLPVEVVLCIFFGVLVLCIGNFALLSPANPSTNGSSTNAPQMKRAQTVRAATVPAPKKTQRTVLRATKEIDKLRFVAEFSVNSSSLAALAISVSSTDASELEANETRMQKIQANTFDISVVNVHDFIAVGEASVFLLEGLDQIRTTANVEVSGTYDALQSEVVGKITVRRGESSSSRIQKTESGDYTFAFSTPLKASKVQTK